MKIYIVALDTCDRFDGQEIKMIGAFRTLAGAKAAALETFTERYLKPASSDDCRVTYPINEYFIRSN